MKTVDSAASFVNLDLTAELGDLANRWLGTTRHVARALIELWKGSQDGRIQATAQTLADHVGCQRAAVLRALRRMLGSGMLAKVGGRFASCYRFLVGEKEAPAAPAPPLLEIEKPEPPLSKVEGDICYAVRNARDEALHGPPKVAEWPRKHRSGEVVPGGFSSVQRARRVCLWVLAFAEANGEWWETIANFLGRYYVSIERRRLDGRGMRAGCPMDWIAFDGGRDVLTSVDQEYARRRRLERQRALARQQDDFDATEAAAACAALLLDLDGGGS